MTSSLLLAAALAAASLLLVLTAIVLGMAARLNSLHLDITEIGTRLASLADNPFAEGGCRTNDGPLTWGDADGEYDFPPKTLASANISVSHSDGIAIPKDGDDYTWETLDRRAGA